MRILVTGGAGFIGSHVAEAFLSEGHEVAVLDDLSSGHRENLPPGVPLEVGSITDPAAVERAFAAFRPEIVSHHAAQINVRRSVEEPAFDAGVNILGTINLAEASVRHRVSRFIFASSGGAIYGEQEEYPATESHPLRPLSPYGVSKLAAEKYLYCYRENWGLPYVVLRYANVYGPRQDPLGEAGVVAVFFNRLLAGEQPVINGDGGQTRDYIYVADVARANVAASRMEGREGVFNVGTGVETSVNELFGMVCRVAGAALAEKHGPAKKGEQRRSCVDASLLGRAAGWKAATTLDEGLKETYKYFRGRRAGR